MPSLRRTLSSPAVRPSPYSNAPLAARGNGHRRSSGSDTTTRRVLADIEWWRVTEGQCDPGSDQETEDRNRGTQDSVTDGFLRLGIPLTHVDAGIDSPVSVPRGTADRAGSNEVPSTFTVPLHLAHRSLCNFFFTPLFFRSPCSSHLLNSFLHWLSRLIRRDAGIMHSGLHLRHPPPWSRLPRQQTLRSISTLTKLP